jgi:hypothetical protein
MDVYQTAAVFIVFVGSIGILLYVVWMRARLNRGDPTVWEKQIRTYEVLDEEDKPPDGSILFTGSSSIRYWKTLVEDMAPLQVLNRGFGGYTNLR